MAAAAGTALRRALCRCWSVCKPAELVIALSLRCWGTPATYETARLGGLYPP